MLTFSKFKIVKGREDPDCMNGSKISPNGRSQGVTSLENPTQLKLGK